LSSRLLSKNIKITIYKIIILHAVLYGCEGWALILREVHRLRVFEFRVVGRIFGPKRDEVIRDCRKVHNEELHKLFSTPNIIGMMKSRRIRWAVHVGRMGRRGMHMGYRWGSQKERETTRKTKKYMGGQC
jgi:hypothetical protein